MKCCTLHNFLVQKNHNHDIVQCSDDLKKQEQCQVFTSIVVKLNPAQTKFCFTKYNEVYSINLNIEIGRSPSVVSKDTMLDFTIYRRLPFSCVEVL